MFSENIVLVKRGWEFVDRGLRGVLVVLVVFKFYSSFFLKDKNDRLLYSF